MKRFHFKLQAVLTLRQRAEQLALEQLGAAARVRQSAAAQVTAADMALSEARRRWLHEMADGCPALRAAQILTWCRELEGRKQQCEEALRQAELLVGQRQQQLLHARQQREVVEKYQGGQRDLYERELLTEERKLIDDLVQRTGSWPAGQPDSAPDGPSPFTPATLPASAESGGWNFARN